MNENNTVSFEFQGIHLSICCAGEGLWRILSSERGEADKCGAAQSLSGFFGEEPYNTELEIKRTEKYGITEIAAADGSSVAISAGKIEFFDKSGKSRKVITGISKNGEFIKVTSRLARGVCAYGTGERFDKVNQHGKKLRMYAIDQWCRTKGNSYCPIPFVICSDMTAMFMNRYEYSVIGLKNSLTFEQEQSDIDLYVFISDSPAKILEQYCRITGFTPVPADWNFGTLVCRYHPEFATEEGVMAMVKAMEENDFPWDAIIMEGFRAMNKENWKELGEISKKIHALGKKVMIYEQCGKFPKEADTMYGLTDNYAVQGPDGALLHETRSMNFVDNLHNHTMKCIDITSRESIDKWNKLWNAFVFDMDIDGAKIDFCEQVPDHIPLKFADGRKSAGAHHWYPVFYNIIRYRHFNSKPDGGMNFSRGGGIGAQRYPFIWAGDQRREFFFLPVVIRAALSLGLSGVPFVSWDMAGYMPAFNPYDRSRENKVFMRGVEFTAFSPVIQTHGKVSRPYDFDDYTKKVYRLYSKLHEKLRPYLVEQAKTASQTGLPMMRHLFLYDGADKNCLKTEDEYMLGDSLLVCPVLGRRNRRDIYLPKGNWTEIFTGEKFTGPQKIRGRKAGIGSIPVFLLEGNKSETIGRVLEESRDLINEIKSLAD